MFVDREFELDVLNDVWSRGIPSLIVIYGRRRVGKTALSRMFLKGKGGLYVIVNYEDVDAALRDLEDQVSEVMG
ncbi:MAG: ATP-binding protein, partial [Thermoprotei archaeon]